MNKILRGLLLGLAIISPVLAWFYIGLAFTPHIDEGGSIGYWLGGAFVAAGCSAALAICIETERNR